jgi:hypothetical protein
VNDLKVQGRLTAMALVLAAFPYPVDLLWNILRCIQKTEKSDFIRSVCPYVCGCPSAWNLAPITHIFMKFNFLKKICPQNSSFIKI